MLKFTNAYRRELLRLSAWSIIGYSISVVIYANIVPHLPVELAGSQVYRVNSLPVAGISPKQGDFVVEVAGRGIFPFPRLVNTIANSRDPSKFPGSAIEQTNELANLKASVADLGTRRFVRVDYRSPESGDKIHSAWFELEDLPWQDSALSVIWFAFESLIFWTAWLALRRRPHDDSAALFFLMCAVTVGAYMGGYHWQRIASSPALIFIFVACAMAVPSVSLHFFLVFPRPKQVYQRYPGLIFFIVYLVPAIFEILMCWSIGQIVSSFRHQLGDMAMESALARLGLLIRIYLPIAALLFAGCVVCLVHAYVTVRTPIERSQVRWILLGSLFSSMFITYTLYLAFVKPVEFALGGATWAMFAASIVFTWAYSVSILKFRLLDFENALQRGSVYILSSFVAGATYYLLLLTAIWISPRFTEFTQGRALMQSIFIAVVILVLSGLRSRFQRLLDRRFHREKHQLERTMTQLNQTVGQMMSVPAVARNGLLVVQDVASADGLAIYVRVGEQYPKIEELGEHKFPEQLASTSCFAALKAGQLVQAGNELLSTNRAELSELRRLGIELAIPLMHQHELYAVMLIGPKRDGAYTAEELDFLEGIAKVLVVTLRAAESQQKLESLNAELADKVAKMSRQKGRLIALQSASPLTSSDPTPSPDATNSSLDEPILRSENLPLIGDLEGQSTPMQHLARTVKRVAGSNSTVLLRGESGTGKSRIAEVIHQESNRAKGEFVRVHCAALSGSLLESELFGHVKGAFTGAIRDKVGRFEKADRGTIFLDEIGDIPLDTQTKLLRVLQEMTFEPVGSSESIKVDVRVIGATHQPLEQLIKQGKFREDLFYRLNVISLHVPPLRERIDDIPILALKFLDRAQQRIGKELVGIESSALEAMMEYEWPGNIRELENVIERAAVLSVGSSITLADLPPEIVGHELLSASMSFAHSSDDVPPALLTTDETRARPMPERLAGGFVSLPPMPTLTPSSSSTGFLQGQQIADELAELERKRIEQALRESQGNRTHAAKLLGIPRTTLTSRMRKLGIN